MTPIELESSLPNGFHDAVLERIDIDYVACVATLSIDLWIDLLDSTVAHAGRMPVMRRATVRFRGLAFCTIDPPQTSVPLVGGVNVEGVDETSSALGRGAAVPAGHSLYSFFAGDLNSYIRISARDVSLEWREDEGSAWSRAREGETADPRR